MKRLLLSPRVSCGGLLSALFRTSARGRSTAVCLLTLAAVAAPDPGWQHRSSRLGDLPPPPGGSTQQTGAVVGDFDSDGLNDFLLACRQKPPALTWYRRTATGWEALVIEPALLTLEAGGAVQDIDGDGDLDVVFGGDWQSNEVWWWENPAPHFDAQKPWARHLLKSGGANQHHDQCFGDFLGTGRPQLAFWNQQAKTLYLAEVPPDPRHAAAWPLTPILTNARPAGVPYLEGLSAFDVDADGQLDLLACDSWLKHTGGRAFKRIPFARAGGLILAGYFKPAKYPQIVISPGDTSGRVRLYECVGHPENPDDWRGADLLDREVVHGHSLQLADFNRDGHLDLFVAEMAQWGRGPQRDHPQATAWILYGDGRGNFRRTELVAGHGWHEARVADLDNDGDPDLLNKPYTWDTPRLDVWLNGDTRPDARGTGTSRSFHGPVGLQLYSLRDLLAQNLPLGLQTVRNLGFRQVELAGTYGLPAARFRALLDQAGLQPVSALFDYDRFAADPENVAAEARTLGVQAAGVAWIPHQAPMNEAAMRAAAAVFNRAGEVLARHGLRFFYHLHGYEFAPHGEGTLFDLLARETRPDRVAFQMDIFWAAHAGQDPVQLLRQHGRRWLSLHLKDMRAGTATGRFTGGEDVRSNVPLGTGQLDLPAILRTAQEIGVKHYCIEDESPAVLEQLPLSVRYLESLAW